MQWQYNGHRVQTYPDPWFIQQHSRRGNGTRELHVYMNFQTKRIHLFIKLRVPCVSWGPLLFFARDWSQFVVLNLVLTRVPFVYCPSRASERVPIRRDSTSNAMIVSRFCSAHQNVHTAWFNTPSICPMWCKIQRFYLSNIHQSASLHALVVDSWGEENPFLLNSLRVDPATAIWSFAQWFYVI